MITNVPSASELHQTALRLYFSAWGQVFQVVEELYHDTGTFAFSVKDGRLVPSDESRDELDEYIERAQPDLQLAYTLIQQSQEIALKARICAVSPFLLLLGSDVRTWARPNADFTEFRTLDASDLVRVVNSVCPQPLSNKFATQYETLRGNRNKIYHLGLYKDRIDPITLIGILVDQYSELYAERNWLQDRLEFQSQVRLSAFYYKLWNEKSIVLMELSVLLELLTKGQFKALFGFAKNSRRYICHECCHDARIEDNGLSSEDVRTATLVDGVDAVLCHLCSTQYPIRRAPCLRVTCKCNVISNNADYPDLCHLCGQDQNVLAE